MSKNEDPENGLAFDLLSSVEENVIIGHANGVITIDLAESRAAHREQVREKLGEPYRTMLGHFRHEVGHYYEWQLVRGDELRSAPASCSATRRPTTRPRSTGTTPRVRRPGWESSYISSYATMHPFEDFAETWAHYLHICDTHRDRVGVRPHHRRHVTSVLASSATSSSGSGSRSASR